MKQDRNTRILVADDESSFLKALVTYLEREYRCILMAHDGDEAVRILEKNPPIDIVVTDLVMPGADGLAVLKKALEANQQAFVILMTGYGSIDMAVCAMREGAFDYKAKPLLLDEIELAIQRAEEHLKLRRERDLLIEERNALKERLAQTEMELGSLQKKNALDTRFAGAPPARLRVLRNVLDPHHASSSYQHWDSANAALQEDLIVLEGLKDQGIISLEEYSRLKNRISLGESMTS
jgi:DNA-binding NtrC family response regulator